MKNALQLLILVVGLTMGLNSCKTGTQNSFANADKESITKSKMDIVKAFNDTKDYDAFVNAYYVENATVLLANSAPIQGRAAITSAYKPLGEIKMDLMISDIDGKDDLAYVYGTYTMEILSNGAKDKGNYVEIWRKQPDGKWQVVYDISNTSVPVKSDTTKM